MVDVRERTVTELKYTFDSKKLIDDFPPDGQGALMTIKNKFKKVLKDNPSDFLVAMNPSLKMTLGIPSQATVFTEAQRVAIVDAIILIE